MNRQLALHELRAIEALSARPDADLLLIQALTGTNANDLLTGTAGADTLNGGVGQDTMSGGLGNDTYVVDDAGDVVLENPGGGIDKVSANISYILGTELEQLKLTGSAHINGTGNALANKLTGNVGNNVLSGGAGNDTLVGDAGNDSLDGGEGNDTLNGGAGFDALAGGLGDDTYVVVDAGDLLTETAGEGIDKVSASISYTLGAELENLKLTGLANLNGTGNSLANKLTGNTGNNLLSGDGGNDTLVGDAGDDTLDGGLGNDTLNGGAGNDTFYVDSTKDKLVENAGEGIDTVYANVTYTLAANVDNLTLTGSAHLNATGNELDNVLTGNDGNNSLAGGEGHDTLDGGAGSNTLEGGAGNDLLLIELGSANTLDLGAGNDTVQGSAGNHTYLLEGGGSELITLTSAGGSASTETFSLTHHSSQASDLTVDRVTDTVVLNFANGDQVTLDLAALAASGTAQLDFVFSDATLSYDELVALYVPPSGGTDGDDTLDGGTMAGGLGNDTYIVDSVDDVVVELPGQGTDTVLASISYTLGANVENLTLTGSAHLSGTGNQANNQLQGNSGSNLLDAGKGVDSLNGGAGDDYLYASSQDGDTLDGGSGSDYAFLDYVDSALGLNFTLGATPGAGALSITRVEALYMALGNGSNYVSAEGSSIYLTVDSGDGNDTLIGGTGGGFFYSGSGSDSLRGSSSDDHFNVVADGSDTVEGGAGWDVLGIDFSASATPLLLNLDGGAMVASVSVSGIDAYEITLGAGADWVSAEFFPVTSPDGYSVPGVGLYDAGGGNDTLIGSAGDDSLDGGSGDDSLVGGAGDDHFVLQQAGEADTLVGGAGTDYLDAMFDTATADVTLDFAAVPTPGQFTVTEVEEAYIETGSGDDRVSTQGLETSLYAFGHAGNDTLLGGLLADYLDGGTGNDSLDGGDGDDTLVLGDVGADTVDGGDGYDELQADFKADTAGVAISIGGPAESGGPQISNVEYVRLELGTGNDLVSAAGLDVAVGLFGYAGNDTLLGGLGSDYLEGDIGSDSLDGGDGDDSFSLFADGLDTVVGGDGEDSLSVNFSLDATGLSLVLDGASNLGNLTVSGIEHFALTLGAGNDTVDAAAAAYRVDVQAGAGNDSLIGSDWDDSLDGGDGVDSLLGGLGDDWLVLSDLGADTVDGGDGSDVLSGSFRTSASAVDLVFGVASASGGPSVYDVETAYLDLSDLADSVSVGAESLRLWANGWAGNDTLLGGNLSDTLIGGTGTDSLAGGDGNDYLYVSDLSADAIDGGAGADTFNADYHAESTALNFTLGVGGSGVVPVLSNVEFLQFSLGSGADFLSVNGAAVNLTASGGEGNDTLLGGSTYDNLSGGLGNDSLSGGAGNDQFYLDDQGQDSVDGGTGSDALTADFSGGDAGLTLTLTLGAAAPGGPSITGLESATFTLGDQADYLSAGSEATSLRVYGMDGDDTLIGGSLADSLYGGTGTDSLDGAGGNDRMEVDDQTADTIDGGLGSDSLIANYSSATQGLDLTLGVSAGVGSPTILNMEFATFQLGVGDDLLSAGSTATRLTVDGGEGNDTLVGGSLGDTLDGGLGQDVLTGAAGADRFEVGLGSADVITDFVTGSDKISITPAPGDQDATKDGALLRSASGGFSSSAELVIFTSDISGAITADKAATQIGSATSAYMAGQTAVFAVDNGTDTALYYFASSGNDASVSASELVLMATLSGTASTAVNDYLFVAVGGA